MKTYENILLDWDGNLAKTLDVWLEACREVLLELGHNLTDREIGESFGSFPMLLSSLGVEDGGSGMSKAAELATSRLLTVELYPSASTLLRSIRSAGKKSALITSSESTQVEGLLTRHEIGHYFDTVVTGEMTERRKPDPEPLLLAMSHIGAVATNTIIVGDSDKDIIAASIVGIDSVLFFPPTHQKFYHLPNLRELNPTYIVEDLADVGEIIFATKSQ